MSNSETSESDYLKYWLKVKELGQQKCELGKELSKQGAWEMDVADTHLRAAEHFPPLIQATALSEYPQRLSLAQQQQLTSLDRPIWSAGTAVTTAGSVGATMSYLTEQKQILGSQIPQVSFDAINSTIGEFTSLFERNDRKGEALKLLTNFGFPKSANGLRAIRQFEAAWAEHEGSPWTPTASLIPMREALRLTVDELLQRRPIYSKGKIKQKVVEIGNQASASGLTAADFDTLQASWDQLWTKLSMEKEASADRLIERSLMIQSTSFLIQLLNATDLTKLRTP